MIDATPTAMSATTRDVRPREPAARVARRARARERRRDDEVVRAVLVDDAAASDDAVGRQPSAGTRP